MKILITGCNGFVGKRLSNVCRDNGHTVIGVDSSTGLDVSDWNSVKEIPKFDLCYHLAARSFVPDSYVYPRDFYNINCSGTINILELCRHYNARMIFVSSYVYGKPEYIPIDENHPVKPFNPYSQTKIIGEKLCEGYNRDFNLPIFIVRPFNLFGPGQNKNFLIPSIISQLKNDIIKIKDPRPRRDFVYIDDFVELLRVSGSVDFKYTVVNASSGTSYSVLEIVQMLLEISGLTLSIEVSKSDRIIEIQDTLGSFQKAYSILGWKPKFSMLDGFREIIGK
jgi:UDP-glucose 4-epimerase